VKQVAHRIRSVLRRGLIPPEIDNDVFSEAIARIAALPSVMTILEIGSSSGAGSTKALVEGALRNSKPPTIHCFEASPARFKALESRYRHLDFVKCHHLSSVSIERFPTETTVREFYETAESSWKQHPQEMVLEWLRSDLQSLKRQGISCDGIQIVLAEEGLEHFDMVVIDGSEFTGSAELDDTYGARFILLDDIRSFKNHDSRARLLGDPEYALVEESATLRNGYAVFERISS